MRRASAFLAESPLLRRGQRQWKENEKNRDLPLSKSDKLLTGAYLILRDYGAGVFPPQFSDQNQTHLNEINTRFTTPGLTQEQVDRAHVAKPFWFGPPVHNYFRGFLKLVENLELARVRPPARLLELGGGAGWTAEFLAQFGFPVVSTTLSPYDASITRKRAEALHTRGLDSVLESVVAPMESIDAHVKQHCPFNAVFVFEALHHAFDWRSTIASAYDCLSPGGWLLICNEPNFLHTAIAYRVAILTNTHEVGFRKSQLLQHLKKTGFRTVISTGKQPHFFFRPLWLLAQK